MGVKIWEHWSLRGGTKELGAAELALCCCMEYYLTFKNTFTGFHFWEVYLLISTLLTKNN